MAPAQARKTPWLQIRLLQDGFVNRSRNVWRSFLRQGIEEKKARNFLIGVK